MKLTFSSHVEAADTERRVIAGKIVPFEKKHLQVLFWLLGKAFKQNFTLIVNIFSEDILLRVVVVSLVSTISALLVIPVTKFIEGSLGNPLFTAVLVGP